MGSLNSQLFQWQTEQTVAVQGSFKVGSSWKNMYMVFLKKRALFKENLLWINQGLKSKETAYLDVERKVKWSSTVNLIFTMLDFAVWVCVSVCEADVSRRKSSHIPHSKQCVINIDILLWQLQTPKFVSVPPQQTQTNTHTCTYTKTLLCQQTILSCVESLYSSKSDTLSSRDNTDSHTEMLDLLSETCLSRLVLPELNVARTWSKIQGRI